MHVVGSQLRQNENIEEQRTHELPTSKYPLAESQTMQKAVLGQSRHPGRVIEQASHIPEFK
jgi:hypothetical protein